MGTLMEFVSFTWLAALGFAAAWTILFSFSNTPGVRGWRNLGLLACYILGIGMAVVAPWRAAVGTWVLFGVVSGALYFAYEAFGYFKHRSEDSGKPRVATIANGLLLWPIMLPEVIEYSLADAGVLKSAGPTVPPEQT